MNYLDFIERYWVVFTVFVHSMFPNVLQCSPMCSRDSFYDDPLHWSYKTDSSSGERTEDSNDENHWKNDYPDEDEHIFADCMDVDDTRPGVEQLDLDQEWEVSFGSEFGNPLCEEAHDDLADNDEFRDVDDDDDNVELTPFRYTSNQTRIMKHLEKLRHESKEVHIDDSDYSRSSLSSRESSGGEEDHN